MYYHSNTRERYPNKLLHQTRPTQHHHPAQCETDGSVSGQALWADIKVEEWWIVQGKEVVVVVGKEVDEPLEGEGV